MSSKKIVHLQQFSLIHLSNSYLSNSNNSASQVVIVIFLAKTEKTFSNSSQSQVVIYPKLGKTDSARAYIRLAIRNASSRIRRGGRV
jgi:hypothetical protein